MICSLLGQQISLCVFVSKCRWGKETLTAAASDRFASAPQVGDAFKKPKALDELRLIASGPGDTNVFQVTNYSALEGLLSTLQQSIIGIEGKERPFCLQYLSRNKEKAAYPVSRAPPGTQGDALEYELAQAGFRVQVVDTVRGLRLTLPAAVAGLLPQCRQRSGGLPKCETCGGKSPPQALDVPDKHKYHFHIVNQQ